MAAPTPPKALTLVNRFKNAATALFGNNAATVNVPAVRASNSSGSPYDAGSTGRRSYGWNPTRLGPTTSLYTSLDRMVPRSRDAIRNNPWAASAIDNFEAQVISTGIRPRWKIKNKSRREHVEAEFAKWARRCDACGQSSFYGMQGIAAREMFEGGEVFARMHIRPPSFNMRVPLQIQLMETEQLPLWRNSMSSTGDGVAVGNTLRAGIEFDQYDRRVAYHFYRAHPGETMFYPMDGLSFQRVPAEYVIHCYRPLRAGQLRGQPHLASVLTMLYELEQYEDFEILRKKTQTLWAAWIRKTSPDTDVVTVDPSNPQTAPAGIDPGTANVHLEGGTLNELLPGEDIIFPTLPQDSDFSTFMRHQGHRFAAAVGATYEQITGDLNGVTYSSIRAGLLDFRRKCEMLQHQVFVQQFCQPIAEMWLKEAFMAGVIDLPGYARDPDQYTDILWTPSGWDWVDPLSDVQASIFAIRAGLDTRSRVVAGRGRDVAFLDEEWVADRDRAHELSLVYDTDPSQVLTKGARNPVLDADGNPIEQPGVPAEPIKPGGPTAMPKPKPAAPPAKKAAQKDDPLLQ